MNVIEIALNPDDLEVGINHLKILGPNKEDLCSAYYFKTIEGKKFITDEDGRLSNKADWSADYMRSLLKYWGTDGDDRLILFLAKLRACAKRERKLPSRILLRLVSNGEFFDYGVTDAKTLFQILPFNWGPGSHKLDIITGYLLVGYVCHY